MTTKGINRRDFLRTSGYAVAGAAVLGSGTMILASDGAWAMTVSTLDEHTARSLLAMARTLYPHDFLSDQYYAVVVEGLDGGAAGDPSLATQLAEGVAGLDSRFGVPFVDLSEGNQLEAVKAIEGSPFFTTMQNATVWSLYPNPLVWRFFRYEGPSAPHGGYIDRGFDDINWLPQG